MGDRGISVPPRPASCRLILFVLQSPCKHKEPVLQRYSGAYLSHIRCLGFFGGFFFGQSLLEERGYHVLQISPELKLRSVSIHWIHFTETGQAQSVCLAATQCINRSLNCCCSQFSPQNIWIFVSLQAFADSFPNGRQ